MPSEISFLDKIDIAAPCSASWEEMDGDARKRFCSHCRKNVYNLSDMTRGEAEILLRESGGHGLCTMFYRRSDGTILNDNCPVGLRAVRNAVVRRWVAVASLAASLFQWSRPAQASGPPASSQKKPGQAKHLYVGESILSASVKTPLSMQPTKGTKAVPTRTMGKPAAVAPTKLHTKKKRAANTAKKDDKPQAVIGWVWPKQVK